MSLKCQLCGKEIYHDRKVCHQCEDSAEKSRLHVQDGRHNNKWRCDNFLELNSLVFGSNLTIKTDLGSKLIECAECGEEYSYGRNVIHTCENNVIPFGKIFGTNYKARKWNCDDAKGCMELSTTKLETIEPIVEVHNSENLEKIEYNW
ncbi:MAG: hypothetical protein ACW99L_16620, partial [Promethearchaeota archaeon]